MGSDSSQKSDGSTASAFKRRERIYQTVIWVFVMWNLVLQYRAAPSLYPIASAPSGPDVPHTTFVQPDSYTEGTEIADAAGRKDAGVVCSGCSDENGLTPADKMAASIVNASNASAAASNARQG